MVCKTTRMQGRRGWGVHEADDGDYFDNGKGKLGFAIALDSKKVNHQDDDEKHADEDGLGQRLAPVANGQ
jgi:hypothetical protein